MQRNHVQPWLVKDMDTPTFQRPIDWNYAFNSEKSVSNGVISVEHRRRRHRHRHRHGGIRNNWEAPQHWQQEEWQDQQWWKK